MKFIVILRKILYLGVFIFIANSFNFPFLNGNKICFANDIVYQQNVKELSAHGTVTAINIVQQVIQKNFPEGLDFDGIWSLSKVDPMKIGLFICKNRFTGKVSRKEYEYSFRFGANKLVNGGNIKVYYINVGGEIWYFDETGEDQFISAAEKALENARQ